MTFLARRKKEELCSNYSVNPAWAVRAGNSKSAKKLWLSIQLQREGSVRVPLIICWRHQGRKRHYRSRWLRVAPDRSQHGVRVVGPQQHGVQLREVWGDALPPSKLYSPLPRLHLLRWQSHRGNATKQCHFSDFYLRFSNSISEQQVEKRPRERNILHLAVTLVYNG